MRTRFYLTAVLATVFHALPLRANIIGYETFRYAGGTLEGADGGTFWDYDGRGVEPVHTGKASDWEVLFGATALSGGKLLTADGGVSREYSGITEGVGSDESMGYFSERSVPQTIYYRFDMTRGTGATWCGLSSFSFEQEQLFFGLFPDGTGKFSIYDQRTFTRLALSTQDVTPGQKFTVVVRMDINTLGGPGSQLRLYINPILSLPENPATAVASAVLPGQNNSSALRLASGGSGLVEWDDLLVTTTWDCLRVTPVTNYTDAGAGSLRQVLADRAGTGGRVQFPAADWLFAVTSDNRLLRLSRKTPNLLVGNLTVTGMLLGETLQGIDFAESTGELYGLGILNPIGDNNGQGRLYKININTGVATRMGSVAFSSTLRSAAGYYGFAWEPDRGQFRIVSESGDNLRVGVDGLLAATEGTLPASFLVSSIAWGPVTPEGRVLYGVDAAGNLVRISPVDGKVTVVGPLGSFNFGGMDGLDITAQGVAWATSGRAGLVRLNRINLLTGTTTETGTIGDGSYEITGLAAAPDSIRLLSEIRLLQTKAIIVEGPEDGALALDGGGVNRLFMLGEREFGAPADKVLIAFRDLTLSGGGGAGLIRGGGGAMNVMAGNLHLENCTLSGNNSRGAGAIRSWGAFLRLERCTFTGNTAEIAPAVDATDLRMIHCTVSGNHASSNGVGGVLAGAVVIDASSAAAMPVLRACLIAGNTSAGAPPDLSVTGTADAQFCLIGNGEGSGFGNGSGGSRVGTTAAPLPARVGPAGYYGGGNRTMPLLPDSLGVNLVLAGNTERVDQRGLGMNGVPDAGASEFRGSSDLALYWKDDQDRDGVPFGLEFATGTDPLKADRNASGHLAIQYSAGAPVLTFDINDAARPYVKWIVRRSFNLTSFSEEIYSFNGRTSVNTVAPGIFQGSAGGLISLRDQPPNPAAAFYRLEAELLP